MGTTNLGKTYVGLTDDPERRRGEHGNPTGWNVTAPFASETIARTWEKNQLAKGCVGGTGGSGWKHGYWYTIRWTTVE